MLSVEVVNLGAVIDVLDLLNPGAYKAIVSRVAMGAHKKWVNLAANGLQSSRADYLGGLQPWELEDENTATITLLGEFPNMIEHGKEGWDMRDTLLRTPDGARREGVKQNASGGLYRAIPFRHQTPGTSGRAGAPMGSQYAASGPMSLAAPHAVVRDTEALGKAVMRAARRLKPGTKMQEGIPAAFKQGTKSKRVQVTEHGLLRQHHATDIYAGMVVKYQETWRQVGRGGQEVPGRPQRTYFTFRTISDDIPPGASPGWMHPGIMARNYAEQVVEHIQTRLAPAAIDGYIAGLMAKGKL